MQELITLRHQRLPGKDVRKPAVPTINGLCPPPVGINPVPSRTRTGRCGTRAVRSSRTTRGSAIRNFDSTTRSVVSANPACAQTNRADRGMECLSHQPFLEWASLGRRFCWDHRPGPPISSRARTAFRNQHDQLADLRFPSRANTALRNKRRETIVPIE